MRIKSIHLENLRSHASTELSLERIATIRGGNHSGKSTIEQSIELALARRAEVTGAGGHGQADLLRFGKDLGSVELLIEDGATPIELRASLSVRSGLNVTIRNPEDKNWSPVDFARRLKEDQDILSCLCNNRFFIELKPADQKDLLASIILPATYEWPENIKTAAHAQRIHLPSDRSPFEVIEAAYKAAFSARTEVNRAIKEWRAPAAVVEYAGPRIDKIKVRLRELQEERTGIAVEKQRLAGAITQAESAKQGHERRAAEAQKRIDQENAERATIEEKALSKDLVKKLTKEAEGLPKAQALDAETAERTGVLASLKKQIDVLANRKARLELEGEAQCPACMQVVSVEVIEAMVRPLLAEEGIEQEKQRQAFDARKALGDPEGASRRLEASKAVEADLARIDRRIKDLERTFKQATAEAETIKVEELPKPDSLNEQLAQLDKRIEAGTSALQTASGFDALRADHDRAIEAKKKLDAELAQLETLVQYFGPKGVKAELIAKHIGTFEADINKVLKTWGYETTLSLEPYGFVVKRAGSQYAAKLHMLSRSELLRFSNAFSVALAIVSGWGFVVLDDTETIVGEADRKALNGMLYRSELDQAIILAAELVEAAPEVPGTAFIALQDSLIEGIATTRVHVLKSTPEAA